MAVAHRKRDLDDLAVECSLTGLAEFCFTKGHEMRVFGVPMAEVGDLAPMSWRLVNVTLARRIIDHHPQPGRMIREIDGRDCCVMIARQVVERWRLGANQRVGEDVIVLDDPISELPTTREQREKTREWFEKLAPTISDPETVAAFMLGGIC